MAKIIHTADLHLKTGEDKDYSFAVLDEIIALALSEKADFLLISGDLFDSFADLEALRKEVCARLARLGEAGCQTVYIPGNHEELRAPASLDRYTLDNVKFLPAKPFTFFADKGVEFLCVPHASAYDGYRGWAVPPKKPGVVRIALVHALNSTIFTGPDPEDEARAGVIENEFFSRFEVDYAAMGHVHAGQSAQLGGTLACYPGSPRVWRAHNKETGVKTVRLVDTGGSTVNTAPREIISAGRYREYALPLGPDCSLPETAVSRLIMELGKADLVSVTLEGYVDDEKAAGAAAKALEERLAPMARKVKVTPAVKVAADLSSNALARTFLEEMNSIKPPEADETAFRKWRLARQYGLEALADASGRTK